MFTDSEDKLYEVRLEAKPTMLLRYFELLETIFRRFEACLVAENRHFKNINNRYVQFSFSKR